MRITETAVYRNIDTAINQALANRGSLSDDYARDADLNVPVYVRRLCERIHSIIGRGDVSMSDVAMAELSASGHTDYHRKFVLYCAELAIHGKMLGRL